MGGVSDTEVASGGAQAFARLIVHDLNLDDPQSLEAILDSIRDALVFDGDDAGGEIDGVRWEVRRAPTTDLIPRPQRLAAAALLSAVDLPAPAGDFALTVIEATDVCPGVTTADVALGAGRRAGLMRARALIDGLLSEAAA